jgi:putative hydrolase
VKIEVDLHTHTLASRCGIHTHLEIAAAAERRGLRGVAITDHGPMSGARVFGTFFERFESAGVGIRVFRGIEANITFGGTDVPRRWLYRMEVVLAGLHYAGPFANRRRNTARVLRALERCPYIDVVTHPFIRTFPLDLEPVVEAAAACGVALELNNSTLALGRCDPAEGEAMLDLCRRHNCRVAVGSDAHGVNEVGVFDEIVALLEQTRFPEDLVVNRTLESTLEWMEKRRGGTTGARQSVDGSSVGR